MWNLLPESNVFENYLSTTPKNQIESSDVTFEEVLSIYESDFKVFKVTWNRNEKNVSFLWFLSTISLYQS